MKDISTPVPPNEVRSVIKKSLENAALVNYERLSEEARIEGEWSNKRIFKYVFCFILQLIWQIHKVKTKPPNLLIL